MKKNGKLLELKDEKELKRITITYGYRVFVFTMLKTEKSELVITKNTSTGVMEFKANIENYNLHKLLTGASRGELNQLWDSHLL